jgi:hypothetical protein
MEVYRDHNVFVDYIKKVSIDIRTLCLNNIHQRKDLTSMNSAILHYNL